MNLVERLIKVDAGKTEELSRKTIKSKRLAKLLGEEKSVDIEIQEIKAKRLLDIKAMSENEKGKEETDAAFNLCAMLTAEGVIEPNLRNEELQKHYDCHTPKDLAIKLFSLEAMKIGDEIAKLSNITEEDEKEIKN